MTQGLALAVPLRNGDMQDHRSAHEHPIIPDHMEDRVSNMLRSSNRFWHCLHSGTAFTGNRRLRAQLLLHVHIFPGLMFLCLWLSYPAHHKSISLLAVVLFFGRWSRGSFRDLAEVADRGPGANGEGGANGRVSEAHGFAPSSPLARRASLPLPAVTSPRPPTGVLGVT